MFCLGFCFCNASGKKRKKHKAGHVYCTAHFQNKTTQSALYFKKDKITYIKWKGKERETVKELQSSWAGLKLKLKMVFKINSKQFTCTIDFSDSILTFLNCKM